MKPLCRLAVVASGSTTDVSAWSGTPYYITQSLQTRYPDLLAVTCSRPAWFNPARRVARKLTMGQLDLAWSRSLGRRHAERLGKELLQQGATIAVCVGVSPVAAFLADILPIIHVSDATATLMRHYYHEFESLHPRLARSAECLDRASVSRAKACLFASTWAADSAIMDYGADPASIHVVPFGANIEGREGASGSEIRQDEVCNIVFLGVDWCRKRGQLALQAVAKLADLGLKVHLDIIGAVPPDEFGAEFRIVHGFISKSTPEGRAKFNAILNRAHFLLVPTERECFGLFAAEANAFGVPVIATRTGGLTEVVKDGVNGYLLPLEAGPREYAERIASVWRSEAHYRELRKGSIERFRNVLSWDAWLAAAGSIIDRVTADAAP